MRLINEYNVIFIRDQYADIKITDDQVFINL
jgi:hypothetical protein